MTFHPLRSSIWSSSNTGRSISYRASFNFPTLAEFHLIETSIYIEKLRADSKIARMLVNPIKMRAIFVFIALTMHTIVRPTASRRCGAPSRAYAKQLKNSAKNLRSEHGLEGAPTCELCCSSNRTTLQFPNKTCDQNLREYFEFLNEAMTSIREHQPHENRDALFHLWRTLNRGILPSNRTTSFGKTLMNVTSHCIGSVSKRVYQIALVLWREPINVEDLQKHVNQGNRSIACCCTRTDSAQ